MAKYNKKQTFQQKPKKFNNFNKPLNQNLTTTANLRLREEAGFDKTVLTIIPKGETVKVLKKSEDGWYKVLYNNQLGFCLKDWLQ